MTPSSPHAYDLAGRQLRARLRQVVPNADRLTPWETVVASFEYANARIRALSQ